MSRNSKMYIIFLTDRTLKTITIKLYKQLLLFFLLLIGKFIHSMGVEPTTLTLHSVVLLSELALIGYTSNSYAEEENFSYQKVTRKACRGMMP